MSPQEADVPSSAAAAAAAAPVAATSAGADAPDGTAAGAAAGRVAKGPTLAPLLHSCHVWGPLFHVLVAIVNLFEPTSGVRLLHFCAALWVLASARVVAAVGGGGGSERPQAIPAARTSAQALVIALWALIPLFIILNVALPTASARVGAAALWVLASAGAVAALGGDALLGERLPAVPAAAAAARVSPQALAAALLALLPVFTVLNVMLPTAPVRVGLLLLASAPAYIAESAAIAATSPQPPAVSD